MHAGMLRLYCSAATPDFIHASTSLILNFHSLPIFAAGMPLLSIQASTVSRLTPRYSQISFMEHQRSMQASIDKPSLSGKYILSQTSYYEVCLKSTIFEGLCGIKKFIFDFNVLATNEVVSTVPCPQVQRYPCPRSAKPAVILAHPRRQSLRPFFCRSKRDINRIALPVSPVSRAGRYNTLHLASKVVCQKGGAGPLWKPPVLSACWP